MSDAANAASLRAELGRSADTLVTSPTFKRVYQACESCRQKKHKCSLGDPANPKPPCSACRRANIACGTRHDSLSWYKYANAYPVLPPKKRKGRPPKRPRQGVEHDRSSVEFTADNPSIDVSSVPSKDGQVSWQAFMGSLEPVVASHGGTTTSTSDSRNSHGTQQLLSYDQQLASQSLATFPLRNTSDAIRLLDQDRTASNSHRSSYRDETRADAPSTQFFLLQEGLIEEATLFRLFNFYLSAIHPIMPLIPQERRPKLSEQILAMAGREQHLMAAILVVASGLVGENTLHHYLWQRVERLFAQVAMRGTNESLDMLEGLLLLSGKSPLNLSVISRRPH